MSNFPLVSLEDLQAARTAAQNCFEAGLAARYFFRVAPLQLMIPPFQPDENYFRMVEKGIRALTEAIAELPLVEKVEHLLSNGQMVRIDGFGLATTVHRLTFGFALRTRGAIWAGLLKATSENEQRPAEEAMRLRMAGRTVPAALAEEIKASVKRTNECNTRPYHPPETAAELQAAWLPSTLGMIQNTLGEDNCDYGAIPPAFENEFLRARKTLEDRAAYGRRSGADADGNQSAVEPSEGRKPRNKPTKGIPKAEAEILVRDWLAKNAKANPASIKRDDVAAGTGVSSGAVSNTAAWIAFKERRDAEARPVERTVPLSDTMQAVIPADCRRPDELAALIEEQKAEEAEQTRRQERRHASS